MKSTTPANVGNSLIAAAGVPAWAIALQGPLEPFGGPGVGPGDDDEAGLRAGLHRRADLLDHLLGRDDQLALQVAALLRGHLVLDVDPGDPGRLVGADGAEHVQRLAVTGVRVGDDRDV